MYHFENDYNGMCHPKVLDAIQGSADLRLSGYGGDDISKETADIIRNLCGDQNLSVHFLSGGTQANLTVIAASLRPYQAVISALSGHIIDHETGAIEASGHKILTVPSDDGKITAMQIKQLLEDHYSPTGMSSEHYAQPKLVYISFPTEFGTIYYKHELEAIRAICDQYGLYLYIDGARLGYGLCASDCDLTLEDIARFSDAFYLGGTKQGLMFGEAVVISNPVIAKDFRYMIKQRGAMLAKGWLISLQFHALLQDGLYFSLAKQANKLADQIRVFLAENHCEYLDFNKTNQVFAILPDRVLNVLAEDVLFSDWVRVDEDRRMVRFCTSWSTTQRDVDALCKALRALISD